MILCTDPSGLSSPGEATPTDPSRASPRCVKLSTAQLTYNSGPERENL